MKKNANINVSFSWIFMGIIGSFLVLFGYNLVDVYSEIENEKYGYELKGTLESIFQRITSSTGTQSDSIEELRYIFQDKNVELFCEENFLQLHVGDNVFSSDFLKNNPLFMTRIEQEKLDESYIGVSNFKLPFQITPLMFLVSQKNMVVFDKEIWEDYMKEKFTKRSSFKVLNILNMKENFEDYPIDLSDVNEVGDIYDFTKNMNLNSITFVTDETTIVDPNEISKFKHLAQHVQISRNELSLTDSERERYYGQIKYKYVNWNDNFDPNEYNFNYVDWDSTLSIPTASVFSKPETFKCSYNLLEDHLISTYSYYLNKTQVLIDSSAFDECSQASNEANYEIIKEIFKNILNTKNFMNPSDLSSFYIGDLDKNHRQFIEFDSCPTIY